MIPLETVTELLFSIVPFLIIIHVFAETYLLVEIIVCLLLSTTQKSYVN